MKYVYPAIITKEQDNYIVNFPDLKNCFTDGKTLAEAIENAEDVLCLMLYDAEENGTEIPEASSVEELSVPSGTMISLVHCDTLEYRKFFANKAVKKTLTIPLWLNTLAERKEINFSAILQSALKKELKIED